MTSNLTPPTPPTSPVLLPTFHAFIPQPQENYKAAFHTQVNKIHNLSQTIAGLESGLFHLAGMLGISTIHDTETSTSTAVILAEVIKEITTLKEKNQNLSAQLNNEQEARRASESIAATRATEIGNLQLQIQTMTEQLREGRQKKPEVAKTPYLNTLADIESRLSNIEIHKREISTLKATATRLQREKAQLNDKVYETTQERDQALEQVRALKQVKMKNQELEFDTATLQHQLIERDKIILTLRQSLDKMAHKLKGSLVKDFTTPSVTVNRRDRRRTIAYDPGLFAENVITTTTSTTTVSITPNAPKIGSRRIRVPRSATVRPGNELDSTNVAPEKAGFSSIAQMTDSDSSSNLLSSVALSSRSKQFVASSSSSAEAESLT